MKLIDTPNQIEQIGNITDTSSFKMKSSRKAFQILSDLYSDKPLAIVRELGCNANDSMIASGKKDQPFHIHLPNALEPWLTIQDFGTGISHQNIYDIYSTYFESTKTNTNEQIGCLGLGSKSPFCYTDNFSVTSIHDGVKRIYNAYFAENGNPTIALMSTENTSEQNGVAVQIPIKEKDFNSFLVSVVKAFRFFDVKPTISGGVINWVEEKAMFEGEDWMFFDNRNDNESYAIMGGVTYPINAYHLEDKYRQILRKGIVMKFKMGELDFAPSREHLSYDDATIKALNSKLEKVMGEIKDKAKEMILAKENILEAIRALSYFNDRFSYYGNSNFEIKDLIYNGHDITNPAKFIKAIGIVESYYKRSYRKTIQTSNTFSFAKDYTWYVNDGQVKNPVNRVKGWVRTTENSATMFTMDQKIAMIALGFPDIFINVSTLPSPTIKRKVNPNGSVSVKAKEDITIFRMDNTYNVSWKSEILEPTDTDVPEYYIVKGKTWELGIKFKGLRVCNDKSDLVRYCGAYGIKAEDDVVLVGSRDEAKLKARGCKSLVEFFANKDYSWINYTEVATINHYRSYDEASVQHKDFAKLSDNNPIKQLLLKIVALRKKYKKINNILTRLEGYNDTAKPEKLPLPGHQFIVECLCSAWNDREDYLAVAKELEKN